MIETVELKDFPTTRYQGSKRKIIPWIFEHSKELRFETVLDGFGGSASVSYLFKKMGKSVTYNDQLLFNSLIGKALIENQKVKLTSDDIDGLLIRNKSLSYENIVGKYFDGIYYPKKENLLIDKIATNILYANHYPPKILEYKKALAYYALFQSCIIKRPFNLFHRNNLYLRDNDVVRTFGNKTTWEKPLQGYFKRFADEANSLVFNSNKHCRSLNESIFTVDQYGYDLVYLDPPYFTKDRTNETSNYLHCYHFLEGLSIYNEWKNYIDFSTNNLTIRNRENELSKENIQEKMEELFFKFRKSKILFSYKANGKPSIKTLVRLMKKFKKNVHTVSKSYSYALNNQNGEAKFNKEVLIIGY